MGKRTICTVFYLSPVFVNIFGIARTVFPDIHRTVTEQAVKVLQALMTGKIPAFPILKKPIRIFHVTCLTLLPDTVSLFSPTTLQRRDLTDNIDAEIPSSAFHL